MLHAVMIPADSRWDKALSPRRNNRPSPAYTSLVRCRSTPRGRPELAPAVSLLATGVSADRFCDAGLFDLTDGALHRIKRADHLKLTQTLDEFGIVYGRWP